MKVLEINDKLLQEKARFKPHKHQQEIIKAFREPNVRDLRISAGSRSGKTYLAAYIALSEYLKDNRHIAVVCPTYDMGDRLLEHFTTFVGNGFKHIAPFISTRIPQTVKSPWGSWIKFKSADSPDQILGEEYDLVIIDEAARVGRKVWESYIMQRLATRKGKSIMISTPHGQDFFYEEFMRCKNAKDGYSKQFSTYENPYQPKEELDRQKTILPQDVFLQEYMASFLPDAAAAFKDVDSVIANTLKEAEPNKIYVMGVDLAKFEDFSVICVIDTQTNHVVYFKRFQGKYPYQKEVIKETARRYNNARIIVDSTGVGEPIKDDLELDGMMVDDFHFSGSSKEKLIDKLRIYIEQKYVWIPKDENLIDELKALGYQLFNKKTGRPYANVRYEVPVGMHDDCIMGLGLAVWGLTGPPENETPLQLEMKKSYKRPTEDFI